MADAASLGVLIDEAVAAIAVGDVQTATNKITAAKLTLAAIPDVGADGVTASYRDSVAQLESALKDLRGQKGMIRLPCEFLDPTGRSVGS